MALRITAYDTYQPSQSGYRNLTTLGTNVSSCPSFAGWSHVEYAGKSICGRKIDETKWRAGRGLSEQTCEISRKEQPGRTDAVLVKQFAMSIL